MSSYRVAILGATGAVGQELLRQLEFRSFPVSALRLLASPRSSGRVLSFRGREIPVTAVSANSFDDVQIAFLSAGSEASESWTPVALNKGCFVIDNSSAFRMHEDVPLVIPEVNWHHVRDHHRLFPVGNCTGIILSMALAPLRRFGKFVRVVASSYQSVSGAGARGITELENQVRSYAEGKDCVAEVFPYPIAFNLFSHNSAINEHGYNGEEWKVMQEVRKVFDIPDLALEITCVRVPVLRAHSLSINVEFDCVAPSIGAIREAYESFSGVSVLDDRENNYFPMPFAAKDRDEVLVGRIRLDYTRPTAVSLFACGDQLKKGAALNAVQIAEMLIAQNRISQPVLA